MNKKILIPIVIILSILIVSIIWLKKGTVKYVTKPVSKGTITEYVEASGTIKPINTISVGTQVSGTVAKIYVDYNSQVKKGELLAELDPSLFQSNVDQSEAKVNNAKAAYNKAKANLEYKRNNYQRYEHLYNKNYVSRDDVELARSNYLSAQADVSAALAEMNAQQATLKNNLTNLGYSKITSPVDGTVISRAVDVGQTVAASFNTPTLFEVAQDLTKMQIETSVSEADIGKIKVGQTAEYTLDGYPNEKFSGAVTQVRLASTTTNNVVTYTVLISVDNTNGFAIPGMTANVSIITNQVNDVIVVDNKALKFSPPENSEKYENQGIWLLEKGKPVRYEIKTGLSDDIKTQIISDNIKIGDKVIISSSQNNKQKSKNGNMMRRPPM